LVFEKEKFVINLPWSSGLVEGNVNKLKTIKRQIYGRASFGLLRKRLILKPPKVGKNLKVAPSVSGQTAYQFDYQIMHS
jgi:hypothetical protein